MYFGSKSNKTHIHTYTHAAPTKPECPTFAKCHEIYNKLGYNIDSRRVGVYFPLPDSTYTLTTKSSRGAALGTTTATIAKNENTYKHVIKVSVNYFTKMHCTS